MKKILQIPNYMYPHIGGIEQVGRDIADSLLEMSDIEQKIICFNGDAEDNGYVCHQRETVHDWVDGVEVIRCGCIAKISSQSISLTYAKELQRVMDEFQPDIVIFHYPNPFVSTILEKYLKRNFKLLMFWHLDITKQRILGKLFHRQTLRLLERAEVVVPASPNYIQGSPYLKKYEKKCRVISDCVRVERLRPTPKIQNKAEEIRKEYSGKIICFGIGRHVPYKGYTYLVQASKLLDDRFAVCIGGTGPLTEQLKAEAKGDDKIHFLGRISDEDLVAWYLVCDIFCFPSITKNEAFGIALAEGMLFGKPAVTFTIPGSGVNYVSMANETGIECPNGDINAYAAALSKLADDPELRSRYGENAKLRVETKFSFLRFKEEIQQLIKSIIAFE